MTASDSGSAGVIYEVRLEIAPEAIREFDAWLPGHADELLALDGFEDYEIIRHEQAAADGYLRRTVRYRLRDREALDRYFEEHAERLQADGRRRFGTVMRAERQIQSPGKL